MSGSFDKREKGFEAKWAHDEELRFKVFIRRNKLLGLWAAAEMGVTGPAAEAYAKEVVAADFEKAGDEDVFAKVRRDFDGRGVALSDHMLRRKMEELLETAKNQIQSELSKEAAFSVWRAVSGRPAWRPAQGDLAALRFSGAAQRLCGSRSF